MPATSMDIYTLCFKNGTLFLLTITKSNVDRFYDIWWKYI